MVLMIVLSQSLKTSLSVLTPHYTKCGLGTSSINVARELARNAEFQVSPSTY